MKRVRIDVIISLVNIIIASILIIFDLPGFGFFVGMTLGALVFALADANEELRRLETRHDTQTF